MKLIGDILMGIFMILFVGSIVVFNVARLVYFIKCFKKETCSNRKCNFNIFCYKYQEVYTKEEIERILKMLDP